MEAITISGEPPSVFERCNYDFEPLKSQNKAMATMLRSFNIKPSSRIVTDTVLGAVDTLEATTLHENSFHCGYSPRECRRYTTLMTTLAWLENLDPQTPGL